MSLYPVKAASLGVRDVLHGVDILQSFNGMLSSPMVLKPHQAGEDLAAPLTPELFGL